MPPKLIVTVTLAAVLLAGAAGAFVADASRGDVIAAGVRVGELDVGGLTRAEARARLHARLLAPLDEPVLIHAADRAFTLTAREARIRANLDAIVDEAVARSREGGLLARTWRLVSGARLDARVAPAIEYSRAAVQRTVDRVRVAVGRRPVDARIEYAASGLSVRPARAGRTIDARRLRAQLERALLAPAGERTVRAPVERVEPRIAGDELADRNPVVITIDRANFKLRLFKRLRLSKTYPIAVGQVGLETPAGLYRIQNKAINPAWHVPDSDWAGSLAGTVVPGGAPDNPLKSRWLGVYDGVGVHGTDARGSIGTNASHGCIRMLVEDVEELYDQVPVGSPIFIG